MAKLDPPTDLNLDVSLLLLLERDGRKKLSINIETKYGTLKGEIDRYAAMKWLREGLAEFYSQLFWPEKKKVEAEDAAKWVTSAWAEWDKGIMDKLGEALVMHTAHTLNQTLRKLPQLPIDQLGETALIRDALQEEAAYTKRLLKAPKPGHPQGSRRTKAQREADIVNAIKAVRGRGEEATKARVARQMRFADASGLHKLIKRSRMNWESLKKRQ